MPHPVGDQRSQKSADCGYELSTTSQPDRTREGKRLPLRLGFTSHYRGKLANYLRMGALIQTNIPLTHTGVHDAQLDCYHPKSTR